MEQKSLRRRLAALLLMLCLLAAGALPALATSANIRLVDASGNPATGTIRVALYDSATEKALSGGQLTLYRVAEVKRKNGDLSFEYCGDFYGCGIALGDLTDSTLADQLLEYMPQGARGTTKTVDADGNAAFENLELGLYLIVQSKASNGYAPIKPFLVSLPMAENGKWNYEVDASPKVGGYTPVNPDKYDLFLTLRSVPGAIWKGLLLAAVLIALLYWYFGTEQGSAIRATGSNPAMSRAQGININAMKVLGLSLSNGMVALSGGLMAQYQGFADINMGRGAIVIGLAAVIIGEVLCDAIFRKGCNFSVRLGFVVLGGIVYYLVMVLILWLKLDPNDLKLFTAVIVAVFLAVPYLKGQAKSSFHRLKKGGK